MCGIVGYIGNDIAYPFLLKGLKRLEYRGYDSAGMAFLENNQSLTIYKAQGKVANVEEMLLSKPHSAQIGIGHTRWATHGEPCDRNAHPIFSNSKKLAIIHNGIIENYLAIKKELIAKGYKFETDTDTEVLINLIEDIQISNNFSIEKALRTALYKVRGAYCILILSVTEPETILAARKGSPLVIGIGKNCHYIASDASPIVEYTQEVIYVNDYQIAIIKSEELVLKNLGNELITPEISKLDLQISAIEKGLYEDYMLKEIEEQPQTILDCLRGRLDLLNLNIILSGVEQLSAEFKATKKLYIIACGTSWHAALIGKYIIELLSKTSVEVDYSSEFRYRQPLIKPGDIVIAISQSGETADTIVALEQCKKLGAILFGIVNVAGSTISRICQAGIYTHSGIEIGVASTKAYTGQLAALYLLALKISLIKETISKQELKTYVLELQQIPEKISKIIQHKNEYKIIAEKFSTFTSFLYLGRGYNFPTALEAALKLKEITYIHAEGYPAAEMKHGPIALVNEKLPVVFIAVNDFYLEKIISNMQEIIARKGQIILVCTEGQTKLTDYSNNLVHIPETLPIFTPILSIIPLQYLSYFIGKNKKLDVDKPRNLAKSVTVE